MKYAFFRVLGFALIFSMLFSFCSCAANTVATPTAEAWDGTDADTVETSEERFIKAYNAQCSADPEKEDLLKDFGIDHIYTRTLPSGEVQTYVETEVTRTERSCGHIMPAGDWDGTGADSVEVSKEKWLYTDLPRCSINDDTEDVADAYGISCTYTRTVSPGVEQVYVEDVVYVETTICRHSYQNIEWYGFGSNGTGKFAEPYLVESYLEQCPVDPSRQDEISVWNVEYSYIRTLSTGEEVPITDILIDHTERVCGHSKPKEGE